MVVPTSTWVDATPFRAHLRFLMAVGGLSAPDVAALCSISGVAAEHLLDGRGGRTLRRISPETARRLIAVSAHDVRGLRWRLVPASHARAQLALLREAGHDDLLIARAVGLTTPQLAELSGAGHCSELVTVRLTALARAEDARLVDRRRAARLPSAA